MTIRTTSTAAVLLAALVASPAMAAPATGTAAAAERAAGPRTRLTFTVADCEGCEVQLVNARSTLDADVVHVWQSRTRKVRDGKVTFRIAAKRTWGMSVTVRAPWEGHTGYLTTVAWRYDGERSIQPYWRLNPNPLPCRSADLPWMLKSKCSRSQRNNRGNCARR